MLMQLSVHEKSTMTTDYVVPKPDPVYGFQLQDNAVAGISSEGTFTIDYTEESIELNGGELVFLRTPQYNFKNLRYGDFHKDTKFSPRVAQQMIGMGLLEAIHENDIIALSDPMDLNHDGISGRVSWIYDESFTQKKLGRFGWKATNPTVIEQSASAFFHDMGLSSKLKSDPISIKILDLIFLPPENKPYFMGVINGDFFCFFINCFKNKFVSFAILFNLFCIFLKSNF